MKRLLLVRHAESYNNVAHARLIQEHGFGGRALDAAEEHDRVADPDLSETGRIQAELLGQALKERLQGEKVLLISSPMLRALLTAGAVRKALKIRPALFRCVREFYEVGGCYYGSKAEAGMNQEQIEAQFSVDASDIPMEGWFAGHNERESWEHARQRSQGVLDRINDFMESDSVGFTTLVVISHGDLMTRLLRLYLNIPWQQHLTFVHGNTAITELLRFPNGDVMLNGVNDLSHLPPEFRTGLSMSWRNYGQPELEILRFQGKAQMPEALQATTDHLRTPLLHAEGKILKDYDHSDQGATHFLATVRGKLAGYVQYDPSLNRLRQMIVDKRFRGGGIGSRLVAAVKEEAEDLGQNDLQVHAWARSDKFYRSQGFQPEGKQQDHGKTPWLPMVCMFA